MKYEYIVEPLSFSISATILNSLSDPDPAYKPFLRRTGKAKCQYKLTVKHSNNPASIIPPTSAFTFDADQTWFYSKHRGSSCYWSNDPNTGKCLWVMKLKGRKIELVTKEKRINPFRYPVDQLTLIDVLAKKSGFIMHSAGGMVFGKGLAFTGVSGAGKTTISRLLSNQPKTILFSDDRLLVTKRLGEWRIHGTPWPGDARIARNENTGLDALFILKHGRKNMITPLPASKAFETLVSTISIPWHDTAKASAVMDTLQKLLRDVPAYEFTFKPDKSAASELQRFLSSFSAIRQNDENTRA